MTHTPGPWFVRKTDGVICAPDVDDINGAPWEVASAISDCGDGNPPEYDTPGNARLIAAAPELLEACEGIVQTLKAQIAAGMLWDPIEVEAVFAAIAKARGDA